MSDFKGYWKPSQVDLDSVAFMRFMVRLGDWLFPLCAFGFSLYYIVRATR